MSRVTKIADQAFVLPSPFAEGHVCTFDEAEALNGLFAARMRARFKPRVKELAEARSSEDGQELSESDLTTLQSELTALAKGFSFNRNDEVATEARLLARQSVKQALKAEGKRVGDFPSATINAKAEELLASSQGHVLRAMAEDRVAQMRQAAERAYEEIDL